MRVLMCLVPNDVPGGHLVQLHSTAKSLATLNLDVTLSDDVRASAAGFDLVHGLGLDAESVRHFRAQGAPVVLSTIYASYAYAYGMDGRLSRRRDLARRLRLAAVFSRAAVRGRMIAKADELLQRQTSHRLAYECADMLLPNALGEAKTIRDELRVSTPMKVVPNGVDESIFTLPAATAQRSGVLYVGRVDPLKNQLGLVRALEGTGLALTIAGPVHPHHEGYLESCLRAARNLTVNYLGPVDHDDLMPLYQGAAVHVLPSWYETTGLVSLEAALCGCAVVSTTRGHAREYLRDDAWYCDPADPSTIRAAVLAAASSSGSASLRSRILTTYTWRRVAEATKQAYEAVVLG